jgi:hypothetical protein
MNYNLYRVRLSCNKQVCSAASGRTASEDSSALKADDMHNERQRSLSYLSYSAGPDVTLCEVMRG